MSLASFQPGPASLAHLLLPKDTVASFALVFLSTATQIFGKGSGFSMFYAHARVNTRGLTMLILQPAKC